MASWINEVTTSAGGNISMKIAGGYGTITRSGRNISFNWGIRFKQTSSYTYNSVYGILPIGAGGYRYAFKWKSGTHTTAGTWYYCNSSSAGSTSELTPVAYSGTGTAAAGSISLSARTCWQYTNPTMSPAKYYDYHFTVPYPAISKPSVSGSISNITSTSANILTGLSTNPSNYWAVHRYNTSGGWIDISPFTTGSWSTSLTGLSPNTKYTNAGYQVTGPWNGSTDQDPQGKVSLPFWTHPNKSIIISKTQTNVSSTSCIISMNVPNTSTRSTLDVYNGAARVGTSKIRYIRVYQKGSTANTGDHLCQVEAYDYSLTNRAVGKTVRGYDATTDTELTVSNPGNSVKASLDDTYSEITCANRCYFEVDLGGEYDIQYVKIWRYYPDNRTYYETAAYGLNAAKETIQKYHEYTVSGTYAELSENNGLPTIYKEVRNLQPNTSYTAKYNIQTARSNEWSGEQSINFTTLSNDAIKKITTGGSIYTNAWIITTGSKIQITKDLVKKII